MKRDGVKRVPRGRTGFKPRLSSSRYANEADWAYQKCSMCPREEVKRNIRERDENSKHSKLISKVSENETIVILIDHWKNNIDLSTNQQQQFLRISHKSPVNKQTNVKHERDSSNRWLTVFRCALASRFFFTQLRSLIATHNRSFVHIIDIVFFRILRAACQK